MSAGDLSYESELNKLRALYGLGSSEPVDEHIARDAAQGQAYLIFNAARDAFLTALDASSRLKQLRAVYYMRFGAARRLEMVFFAYRTLIFTVPAGRSKPLDTDESRSLTQSLNTIYINITGVLDNLAWSLLNEIETTVAGTIEPRRIGLFLPAIVNNQKFKSIALEISKHATWNKDLKARRDPSAHRIPLTVPPQGVNNDEGQVYNELAAKAWEEIAKGNFKEAQELMKKQEDVGRFIPWFLHDPDEAPIPIYPTVSEDIRHLIEIFDAVNNFIGTDAIR